MAPCWRVGSLSTILTKKGKTIYKIKRKIKILFVAAWVSVIHLCLPSAFAQSKDPLNNPPLERYTCYQVYAPSLTYTYMGYFILQAENKYAWGFGEAKTTKQGRYTFDTKGIRFVDESLRDVTGKFETEKNGRHSLELKIQGKKQYPSDDGKLTWYCNCDPHDPDNKKNKDKKWEA